MRVATLASNCSQLLRRTFPDIGAGRARQQGADAASPDDEPNDQQRQQGTDEEGQGRGGRRLDRAGQGLLLILSGPAPPVAGEVGQLDVPLGAAEK